MVVFQRPLDIMTIFLLQLNNHLEQTSGAAGTAKGDRPQEWNWNRSCAADAPKGVVGVRRTSCLAPAVETKWLNSGTC